MNQKQGGAVLLHVMVPWTGKTDPHTKEGELFGANPGSASS